MVEGNSTPCCNLITCCIPCCWLNVIFEVPANHFALITNESSDGKKTIIYGPGFHIINYFNSL
jgi:hypothetical protein